jgi:hypothetical protein
MKTEVREPINQTESSPWPACPMLLWGTFGTKTPAERRYVQRVYWAAVVAVFWVLLLAFTLRSHPNRAILSITPFLGGAVVTYIVWEFSRYLRALDELARRMQLEAMAWTYLTGLVTAAWVMAFLLLGRVLLHWSLDGKLLVLLPFLYFMLEPVRAGWLYRLSRSY